MAGTVVAAMRLRHPTMEWVQQDAAALEFADGTFAAAVDKGTLDALRGTPKAGQVFHEVLRVLAPEAPLVVVSHWGDVGVPLRAASCVSDADGVFLTANGTIFLHTCTEPCFGPACLPPLKLERLEI